MISLLLVALAVPTAAPLQGACNNQTRALERSAGGPDNGPSEESCLQLTLSIAGNELGKTPAKCIRNDAFYAGTLYRCGVESECNHCVANGFKVPISIYSGGGCPDVLGAIEGLSDLDFSDLSEVPELLMKALTCKALTVSRSFDWSASAGACGCGSGVIQPPGGVGEFHDGSTTGSSYFLAQGNASTLYPVSAINPFNNFYYEGQVGQSPNIGGAIGNALSNHSELHGVFFNGSVSVLHYQAGVANPPGSLSYDFRGRMFGNGTFDLLEAGVVSHQGAPSAAVWRNLFDGSALIKTFDGEEASNVFPVLSQEWGVERSHLTAGYQELYDWVVRPFSVPLFTATQFFDSPPEGGLVISRRYVANDTSSPWADIEYVVDVSQAIARPLERRTYDNMGNLHAKVEYSHYSELKPGVWRPTQVISTTYLEGLETGDRVVTSFKVGDSRALLPVAQIGDIYSTFSSEHLWQVWQ